jgi:hypothetical protein
VEAAQFAAPAGLIAAAAEFVLSTPGAGVGRKTLKPSRTQFKSAANSEGQTEERIAL